MVGAGSAAEVQSRLSLMRHASEPAIGCNLYREKAVIEIMGFDMLAGEKARLIWRLAMGGDRACKLVGAAGFFL